MARHYKLLPDARRQLAEISLYTAQNWGIEQARKYLGGMDLFLEELAQNPTQWKPYRHNQIELYQAKYQKHFLFFRSLAGGQIALIAILHERMDIPNRIREILD